MGDGGIEALFEGTRRRTNLANRVDDTVEQLVIKFATDFSVYSQTRSSNELRKLDVFVSPQGVRLIWLCQDLAKVKVCLKAWDSQRRRRNWHLD